MNIARFPRFAVALGSAAVMLATAATTTATATTLPGGNGKIVYEADHHFYSAVPGHTGFMWLSNGVSPGVSSDGAHVVYAMTDDKGQPKGLLLEARTSDGGTEEIRVLPADTRRDGEPSFVPHGENIVFSGNGGSIFTATPPDATADSTQGSVLTRLTTPSDGAEDHWASYSPNGAMIVFGRDYSYTGVHQVYVMNADGSGQRLVVSRFGDASRVMFSPDGKKLIYTSAAQAGDDHREVYAIDLDGSNKTQLTDTLGESVKASPTYSPDSTKIVYSGGNAGTKLRLRILTLATGATIDGAPGGGGDQLTPNWQATRTAPVCTAGSIKAYYATAATTSVTCTDLDGDYFQVKAAPPAHGTATLDFFGSLTYVPATGFSGDDPVTITATDAHGLTSKPIFVPVHVAPPFALTGVGLSNLGGFKPTAKLSKVGQTKAFSSLTNVTIAYTVSAPASVKLVLFTATTGRKVGTGPLASCVAATASNRRKAACTRYVAAKTVTVPSFAGTNTKKVSTLFGRRAWPVGSYRIGVTATPTVGSVKTATAPFTVASPRLH